jgi:glycosyltransferase involved in cell wall biosynthesis
MCLESISHQRLTADELIVVDDERTLDRTRSIAEAHGARVIVCKSGMAESRNVGFADATTPYLLSLDSDMTIAAGLLSEVRTVLGAGADAATIREVSVGEGYWARGRALDKEAVEQTGKARAIRGFTVELFAALGGYDVDLVAGEDLDLHQRAEARSAKIAHISSAYIEHREGCLSLKRAVRKKYTYGMTISAFNAKTGHGSLREGLGLGERLGTGARLGIRKDTLAVPAFLVLKTAEVTAGIAGALVARRRAGRRPRRSG